MMRRPWLPAVLGLLLLSAGVALFTPASVACALRTTATSKVNGLLWSSSVLGSGIAAAKAPKIASTSCLPGRFDRFWGIRIAPVLAL